MNDHSTEARIELLPPERESILPLLEELSEWMDNKFEIPGTGVRFGIDPLLGLLPGLGDLLSFLVSCFIVSAAARHGVSRITIARMGMNIAIDLVLGSVPLVGDLFDVAWKANTRNVDLLRRTFESPLYRQRQATWGDWLFVVGGIAGLLVALTTTVFVTWTALRWLVSALAS